jgi:hypothetical protein
MDYKKVERALSAITGENAQILTVFESTFRENVSSLDIQILMSGIIPPKIISNCIASALQTTAREAKASGLIDLAAQLWNPLTACLVQQAHTSLPISKSIPDKPSTKSTVKSTAKDKAVPETQVISDDVAGTIRASLGRNRPSAGFFNNSYHSHINCLKSECSFCENLYKQVNITKCSGHKPCHPCGFYPHVGRTLWKLLKTKHFKSEPCKLQNKPCQPGQIQNLASESIVEDQRSNFDDSMSHKSDSNQTWYDMTALEDDPFEKEPVTYPTPSRIKRQRASLDG